MNKQEFIAEFRNICTDTQNDINEAWFEAVGQMIVRKLDIPSEYQYEPALLGGSPLDENSHWHIDFQDSSDEEITAIARFCWLYMIRYVYHLSLMVKTKVDDHSATVFMQNGDQTEELVRWTMEDFKDPLIVHHALSIFDLVNNNPKEIILQHYLNAQ